MRDESDNPTTQMSGQDDTFQLVRHKLRRPLLICNSTVSHVEKCDIKNISGLLVE